jgi:hypothetical protein
VAIAFRGGSDAHRVAIGDQQYDIPARKRTVLRLDVQPRAVAIPVQLDWAERSPGGPVLESASLKTADGVTPLT